MLPSSGNVHAGKMGVVRITELSVYLVGKQEQLVFLYDITQLQDIFLCIQGPGRIARAVYQDGFRSRCDVFFHLGHGRQGKAAFNGCGNGHEFHTCHEGKSVVIGVERFKDDHLVAGVAAYLECYLQRFRSSDSDDDLFVGKVDADTLVILGQSPAVSFNACRVRV